MLRVAAVSLMVFPVLGQDELTLRRFFEGKPVRVRIEMPGTQQGVDLYWKRDPALDAKTYSQRMKNHGRSLAEGDSVRVTMVKMKPKNIEFHLGGGGYGTFGDDSGAVSVPSVPKTSRESQLEKEVKRETDQRRRDVLNRELSQLQSARRREEARLQAVKAELEMRRKAEIAQKRREGGSRFNIWFPPNYLTESVPTPKELMAILAEFVDFGETREPAPIESRPAAPQTSAPVSAAPERLRRGMARDQVYALMGKPSASKRRTEGQLQVDTDSWDAADQTTEVEYVADVVIRFRVASK